MPSFFGVRRRAVDVAHVLHAGNEFPEFGFIFLAFDEVGNVFVFRSQDDVGNAEDRIDTVENMGTFLPISGMSKENSAPSLRPIQFFCMVLTVPASPAVP